MIIKRVSYKEIPYSQDNVNLYKSSENLLKHARTGKDISGTILIDKETSKMIGYVAWERDYIVALEVVSNYRGLGFGEKLLKQAIKSGCKKLSVNKNNVPAISLYKKLGFKENNTNLGPKIIEMEIER